ncbi:hypothetical protein LguiB_026378 [Lonicera macranthoides]
MNLNPSHPSTVLSPHHSLKIPKNSLCFSHIFSNRNGVGPHRKALVSKAKGK